MQRATFSTAWSWIRRFKPKGEQAPVPLAGLPSLVEENPTRRGLLRPTVPEIQALVLRPLDAELYARLIELSARESRWLGPWQAMFPPGFNAQEFTPEQSLREIEWLVSQGQAYFYGMEVEGQVVGQITVGDVILGAAQSGNLGYWISEKFAGLGITTLAAAMLLDYCLVAGRLHRVEINVRPDNLASRRVPEKLGLRFEGERGGLFYIDGRWCDHLSYAVTIESAPEGGFVNKLEGGLAGNPG